ncbi:MAG: tetratricopeptide repeat protein [Candidatus Nitrosopolaris sp.]
MVKQVTARSTNLLSNLSEKKLNNKAAALNNLGKYSESLIYSTKALAIDPNNADALSSKGIALDHLGNYTGAIEYYDKALAVDPKYLPALNN